jgi:hypothetical protein
MGGKKFTGVKSLARLGKKNPGSSNLVPPVLPAIKMTTIQ